LGKPVWANYYSPLFPFGQIRLGELLFAPIPVRANPFGRIIIRPYSRLGESVWANYYSPLFPFGQIRSGEPVRANYYSPLFPVRANPFGRIIIRPYSRSGKSVRANLYNLN
jgi:hypothetical protein